MDITKRKQSKKEIAKIEDLSIKVGDLFIDTHNSILRVGKIKTKKGKVTIVMEHQYGNGEWGSYGESTPEEFRNKEYIKLDKSIEEKEKEVLAKLATREFLEEQKIVPEGTTTLATTGSKENLLSIKKDLEKKFEEIEVMRRVLGRINDELHSIVTVHQEKLEYITKVIGVVELYLGVHEEIVQIREGATADVSEPVHIRQMLLFMDEEVAIIGADQQGLDFKQIELFDKWVGEEDHLNKILPEKKGVVALRVRREDKDYGDPWCNVRNNPLNMMTYLLIRNGDNLYRIWSNLNIHPRMFPTKAELKEQLEGNSSFFDERKIKETTFNYKKHGLLLQGLLERTTILYPLHHKPDIFNLDTHDKVLVFIHDDENLLPSGRLSWPAWQKEVNKTIKVGSRILFFGRRRSWEKDCMARRVPYGYAHCYPPSAGLYVAVGGILEKEKDESQRFLYLPDGEVYKGYHRDTYGYTEYGLRKNRIGFKYYEDEVLSYDYFDLEDVEFYLNCRTERHHYLDMIPLLQEVRKWKLEEIEREKEFVKLIVGRNKTIEEKVWGAIQWWKLKNKWKRGVDSDDAKALRMIERRIKRKEK
jgi:hypothetical protein